MSDVDAEIQKYHINDLEGCDSERANDDTPSLEVIDITGDAIDDDGSIRDEPARPDNNRFNRVTHLAAKFTPSNHGWHCIPIHT